MFTPFFILALPLISGKTIPPVEAIYLSLLIEVCGFGSATLGYYRQRVIDFRAVQYAVWMSVPFAVGVSLIAHRVAEGWLLLILGIALLAMSFLMYFSHRIPELGSPLEDSPDVRRLVDSAGKVYAYSFRRTSVGALLSALGGVFVGFVGIGVGEFKTSYFIVGQKMPARVSVATGVPIVMATVTAAVLTRIYVTGSGLADFGVPWNVAAMCIPAVLLGGQIAPRINRYLNPNRIKLILFVLFCVVGVILILRGLT
ncbi:MAG: sulfite exporter TauE/SafE family protein [Nitrospinota bacterium]